MMREPSLSKESNVSFEVDHVKIQVFVARRENNKKVGEGVFDAVAFYLGDLPDKLSELLESTPDKAMEQWLKNKSSGG